MPYAPPARQFASAGALRGAVHRAVGGPGGEQRLDVAARRVGDRALEVGDGHDPEPRAREEARRGPAHGAQPLEGDPRPGVRHTGPVEGGQGRLGHTTAADQFVQTDAVDLDRERVPEPPPGLGLVVQQRIDGLDRGDQPRLGRGPVDQVLGQPQVLTRRPAALYVRPHRAQVAHQQRVRLRGPGIAVDAALCAAEWDVAVRGVVVQGLLHGHAAGETRDLVQGAAGAHPQPAAGDTAHQPVDDQEALPAREVIGPGQGQQGGGHTGSFAAGILNRRSVSPADLLRIFSGGAPVSRCCRRGRP